MSLPDRFPRGWFVVAWSSDLDPGGVRPLRYFGQDLVLFRTDAGEAVLLDAYCPHLGAHLGHGGRVEGEAIVCPFHAWRFGCDGRCTAIPYAERIPARAQIPPWTVVERSGAIFAWHDPEGGSPDWQVPEVPEVGSDAWTPWTTHVLTVRTHPREIVENVADKAHFPVVHRTRVDHFENVYDGHRATQRTRGTATPPQGGTDRFSIEATYHGPGFQLSDMQGYLHSRLLLAHTPIDRETLDLRFAVSLERSGPRSEGFASMYAENLRLGFHEDIAVWEHKVYRERPRLVAEDGPIGRLRQWYRQFYEERP